MNVGIMYIVLRQTLRPRVQLFEKYMPKDEAEEYAKDLSMLTKWIKISVKPERIASFDYTKDEAYRKAVRG